MRITVTIKIRDKDFNSTIKALESEWRRMLGDSAAELPTDSELSMENEEDGMYFATFTARIRL